MASILDRYGIKEVADVTFYEINSDGTPGAPVLYLDTLKVSTIEQTAEEAEARGGKGNPVLVSWDYGKEITVSIEDALFSPKSLNIMFGRKSAKLDRASGIVRRTSTVRMTGDAFPLFFVADVYDKVAGSARKNVYFDTVDTNDSNGIALADAKGITIIGIYDESGVRFNDESGKAIVDPKSITADKLEKGDKYMIVYNSKVNSAKIIIDANSFPGTYYVTGDTYARSDVDGRDQFFQFIIPKAKMQAENTITLEAEGDPSVFNMNLKVLRPDNGEMMQLVQYDLEAPTEI